MLSIKPSRLAASIVSLFAAAAVFAGEVPPSQLALIKQKLSKIPEMGPVLSARTTGISGLIEVQVGNNIVYTDPNGDFLVDGHITETKSGKDLTQARLDDVNRIDFDNLPFRDAIVWKTGTGKRRIAVFADPNCGYCKRLERDMQQLKDVTVYTFMIAILAEDSKTKLDNIWCVQDRTQAWRNWMLNGVMPARVFGMCSSPGPRNGVLAQRLGIHGTPAIFFEDGTRFGGAASAQMIEERLDRIAAKAGN
ncbi:MAG: DsbC family protein [Burkholderiales bacterium]|nr:DsbC family protein [Burkholderiales bacterium]